MSTEATTDDLREVWSQRWPERQLLRWCLLCIGLGFLMVLGSSHVGGQEIVVTDLLPLLVYTLSLIIVHLSLVLFRFRGDQILPAVVAFLSGLGLLAQTRMGSFDKADPTALTHFVFPAGVLIMLATSIVFMRGRYQRLAAGIWFWAGISLALLVALLATGQRFRGGVYAAGFITPTEMLKVTVVLFLAAFIHRYAKALGNWGKPRVIPPLKDLLPLVGFWALLAGLLLYQRDLGMFVILSVTLLAMLYVGTGRLGYLVYGALGATGLGFLVLNYFLHGQRRIQGWQDPFQDPTGSSWQILQGLSGMYSGGLWGEGFGKGNPEYTPIAESDFIYSVIGEELGFIGCTIVVVFFLIFFYHGLRISAQTKSPYGMLVSTGLTTVIVTQTFLNIGGVTKFIPLTGITLPFISHGGSSLLTGFASLGLILAISDGELVRARGKAKLPGTDPAAKTVPKRRPTPRKAARKTAGRRKTGRPRTDTRAT